ncbi:S41 family peptidase [Faecalibacter bovis]|uniref:Tail specific protease domain-containing protein n=1 Tax=Faecalibacter bovis TaxID=2898187 RepID=A0ABX7XER8_9FLAO|nr:S41 family peptidase [Faecalibacter bovis]QTV06436.1 hypothetical protein J9309_03655 [Faecalibacter bovis]
MNKIVFVLGLLLMYGCQSVSRFNAHIEKDIPVDQLQQDVDYIYKKLKKNHVKLDLYLPQDSIDYKFDSLKQSFHKPLKPNEFYTKIQPVIRKLRHGHTDVIPLFRKSEKNELKRIKNSVGPFGQLTTYWEKDSLYVLSTSEKDLGIKPGSIILKIDSISPYYLKEKYKNTFYGDGFNETYFENRLNRNFFNYFYTLESQVKDSILYTFSYNGESYQKIIGRKFEKKTEEKKHQKDTIKIAVTKPKVDAPKIKNFQFSYNKVSKSYAKTLSFPTNDSAFAVLKVSTFSYGKYNDDYKNAFQIIKDYKVKNLVLDLRNNGGGRLADSYQLFSYFVPNQHDYLGEQLVVNSSSFQRAIVNVFPNVTLPLAYPISLVSYGITSKNQKNENYIKPALSRIKSTKPENVYNGNLYVIINGGSYSASAIISSNLKGFNRAYFVGEETGGDANGSVAGLMPKYKLPNSKLKLQIGTIYLKPNYFETDTIGHGIYPHKEIKTTFKDKLNKVDPQIRWILNDIKNDNIELKSVVK